MLDVDFQTQLTFESSPSIPGHIIVKIRSLTKAAVQAEIDRLTNIVDHNGGWAVFVGPGRDYAGFTASGELNVDPAVLP